jgi:hypothetical protein
MNVREGVVSVGPRSIMVSMGRSMSAVLGGMSREPDLSPSYEKEYATNCVLLLAQKGGGTSWFIVVDDEG